MFSSDAEPVNKYIFKPRLILSCRPCCWANCWGFTPVVFDELENLLCGFLDARGEEEKSEFYIPDAIGTLIGSGRAVVDVLPVESRWFGVTYREDRPGVVAALSEMCAKGEYPTPLCL